MATDDRYPVRFEEWPRHAQLLHVCGRYSRKRLIELLLLEAGRDPDLDADGQRKLSKSELASIYLALNGRHRYRYPDGFDELDAAAQAERIADDYKRAGLLRELLTIGYDGGEPRQVSSESKLRKNDLAAMYLTVEGIGADGAVADGGHVLTTKGIDTRAESGRAFEGASTTVSNDGHVVTNKDRSGGRDVRCQDGEVGTAGLTCHRCGASAEFLTERGPVCRYCYGLWRYFGADEEVSR